MVTHPRLANIRKLKKIGTRLAKHAFPECRHTSLPIPVPGPQGLRIVFLYCAERQSVGGSDAGDVELTQPKYAAAIDAETGRVLELLAFVPSTWGLASRSGWIGFGRSEGRAAVEVGEKVLRLNRAFDRVLGLFSLGRMPLEDEELRLMKATLAQFFEVAEPPLVEIYARVGRHFFSWLRQG
jgi:hypothetical protein